MTPEQRRLLADLLIRWEDLYRQGQDTPAEALCKDHPELTQTLARQISALKRVSWLDKKLDDEGDDPGKDPVNDHRSRKVLAGRYRLDEVIATGGFAEVWRAFDQELHRIIAVKIPKRTVIGSATSFLAEARRVARLKHPAILPVYDVGLEDGDCFFVSEYVEGGSLANRLTGGTVNRDDACRWVVSIAEALDHAHAAGVIHRDVKPANILIDAHGRALLADFGIAQSSMKTGEFAPSLGTLRYMAPEQLAGHAAVPQSDIYSLAVVLYEALTGEPPYSSSDPNTIRHEIATGSQKAWPARMPRPLMPVLSKALSRDPQQRHSSARDFASDLCKAWTGRAHRFPWWPWVAMAMVAGLGAVAIIPWVWQPRAPAPGPNLEIPKTGDVRRDLDEIVRSVDRVTNAITDQRQQEEATKKGLAIGLVRKAKKLFDEGNYSAALEPLEEALRFDSTNPYLYHQVGACHFNMKNYILALHAFDQAVRLAPSNAEYHLHRAYALSLLGRTDEAAEAFEAAKQNADSKVPGIISP